MLMVLVSVGGLLLAFTIALKLAFPLPDHADIHLTTVRPSTQSDLAQNERVAGLTDQSGIRLIPIGVEAFAARVAIIRSARHTIDAQYYIWEGDLSGLMMLQEVIAAADRGVRVRLLIDDNATSGLDSMWRAIDTHPRIAVRLFNPLVIRKIRPLNYLFDFPRLNRRMHNKSMTVDDAMSIVGGRNIGDAYFGAKSEGLFIDLDAMAIGAVVPDISREFQDYWDSASAYPAALILGEDNPQTLAMYRDPKFSDPVLAGSYRAAVDKALATLKFASGNADFTWAHVTLVSDDPAKALKGASRSGLLASHIVPLIAGAQQRFDLVSGYFVPGKRGTDLLASLAGRNVRTRVVTNSIQVTDVPIVNGGYAPSRVPLLRAGVELYEARPQSHSSPRLRTNLGSTGFSGGGESIHAKSFVIDNRILFIGSFNFDPRSALLNCEMGVIIEAPGLASAFNRALDERLPGTAYRLDLEKKNELRWADGKRVFTKEPGTTAMQRAIVWTLSKLPIAWLL